MSSISCACHIMKLARDSFRLKSESVYGRSESWPTCFLNAGGKKKKEEKKANKTERRSTNKPSAKVPEVSFSEAGAAVIHAWARRWRLAAGLTRVTGEPLYTGLAQSFCRHWGSEHAMCCFGTVHARRRPEIIPHSFFLFFFLEKTYEPN